MYKQKLKNQKKAHTGNFKTTKFRIYIKKDPLLLAYYIERGEGKGM